METPKTKLKDTISLVILIILTAVIFKNLYFNLMTFERLTYLDEKSLAPQAISTPDSYKKTLIAKLP